jgi:chromosome segregation ATPase
MCKKLWVAALAVAVGLLIVATPIAGIVISHAKVAWNRLDEAAQEAQPIDYQIEVLEARLPEIEAEIKKTKVAIAKEEVALENLQEQVKKDEVALEKQKAHLRDLQAALKANPESEFVSFTENGRNKEVKRSIMEQRLVSALETCKTSEQALESKKKTVESREKAVLAARDRLETMKANHARAKNDIERLKADYAALQAQQSRQAIPTDDSKTSSLMNDIQKVDNRLRMEKKLADEDASSVVTPEKENRDVVKEVDEYLNKGKDNSKTTANK